MTPHAQPPQIASISRRLVPPRWIYVRDLLVELVVRDIHLRYRGSLLGMAWTLLNPVAELLVLLFIFGTVLRVEVPNYPAYVFIGLLVYGWFQSTLNFATGAIVHNRELIKRPGVPSAILPVVIALSTLFHFLLAMPLLVGLLIASDLPITSAILALPVLIVVQFMLILGVAYPVATMHVWFRDTQHLLGIALQLLFFLTPVFYEARIVPSEYRGLYNLNPMAHVVDFYRAVLLRGELPNPGTLGMLAIASAALLVVGLTWFRRTSHRFADEV